MAVASTHEEFQWMGGKPSVLIFDVNETLLDIESISPLFKRVFGDECVLREWFGQLILYSQVHFGGMATKPCAHRRVSQRRARYTWARGSFASATVPNI